MTWRRSFSGCCELRVQDYGKGFGRADPAPRRPCDGLGRPGRGHPGLLQPAGQRREVLLSQGRLTLRITTKAGKAYIAIGNQGETIPPQQLTHIFDRFHKADSSRSTHKDGVGLGLYIVKTILNTYKEDITVTSQDGFTEFTFTLSEV